MAGKARRRPGAKPPKGVMDALLPLRVLECASEGPGWYDRLQNDYLKGWRPRHPETDEIMNAEVCLAWAVREFASDDMVQAMGVRALQNIGKIAFDDKRETQHLIASNKLLLQIAGMLIDRKEIGGTDGKPINLIERIIIPAPNKDG